MRNAVLLVLALCWPGVAHGDPIRKGSNFTGTWETTFGLMTLTQDGDRVKGTYVMEGTTSSIEGRVEKGKLTFRYQEPGVQGEGSFELAADGQSFTGRWREDGTTAWLPWKGKRVRATDRPLTFDGVWETTYGRMRLIEEPRHVHGLYAYSAHSSLDGTREGNRLVFRYREPDAAGEGWFELSADANTFEGKWKAQGSATWAEWTGRRVVPTAGRVWLVVLETHWEHDLAEPEYSFGSMLRAFFARLPQVRVRHRMFQDKSSFRRWCRELAYIPEPVVLVLAAHGTAEGLTTDSGTLAAADIAESLRYAGNLRLLHFSACLAMKGRLAADLAAAVGKERQFPISGYATAVDWAASAIIDFTYLELVLGRGMSPVDAAEQVRTLLPFAKEKRLPGAAFPAADFRLLAPEGKK
jgi:hypothetical protein